MDRYGTDGFFVEEKMKRAWAANLVVLKDFADICEKYDLKWQIGRAHV